ncbi:NepR family anti-sigma factor [Sphingomonas sp. Y38-1Y]|uniref:NepR family anti-sigma factor n=1 Tax=Sphingomonas sp. Y38-1Y TaxID=3078265 RepID=UPI0028E9D12C|nr:NepR family anti-sigma factor [Sphingomonas sp. Y38-1Y]
MNGLQGDVVRSEQKKPSTTEPSKPQNKNVGDALRAVYREAVEEQVPDDLLDLLKKLG